MNLKSAEIIEILSAYMSEERLARMREIAAQRTRHLTAVFDQLYDLHNVAACIRTADSLGLQEIHVVPHPNTPPPDPYEPLSRTISLGSHKWVDRVDHPTIDEALESLRPRYVLAATAMDGEPLEALPLDRPVAVIFGNEHHGVSPETMAKVDYRITFPMRGFAQSLNVSVAFALIMGELRRRSDRPLDEAAQLGLVARWMRLNLPHADQLLAAHLRDAGRS